MFHYGIALVWIFVPQVSSFLKVKQDPVSLQVHEGDFTTIRCLYDNGINNLAVSAEFFRMPDEKNPLQNASDGRITLVYNDSSTVMTIKRAISCDAGTYVCKVKFLNGEPKRGNGTTLHVIESSCETSQREVKLSYAQTIVEVTRLSLMVVLIILALTLLCKFW